jgi:hypothetical protein
VAASKGYGAEWPPCCSFISRLKTPVLKSDQLSCFPPGCRILETHRLITFTRSVLIVSLDRTQLTTPHTGGATHASVSFRVVSNILFSRAQISAPAVYDTDKHLFVARWCIDSGESFHPHLHLLVSWLANDDLISGQRRAAYVLTNPPPRHPRQPAGGLYFVGVNVGRRKKGKSSVATGCSAPDGWG